MIATIRSMTLRDRNAAIVLAAVKGDALAHWSGGRSGPSLRATALQFLAGMEEWDVF
jgi:hypothetical protein